MTAPRDAPRDTSDSGKPRALDDPAALAWGAALIQVALERLRLRLASEDGDHDAA